MPTRASLLALLLLFSCSPPASSRGAQEDFDWRSDWAVAESLTLDVDTEGYQLPTAIAFVPDPGDGPKDPLYFVTELRGTVKVVANDRSVQEFATVETIVPAQELPAGEGEGGLAGICLAPQQGYVFVTFTYRDEGGLLRNNVARFEVTPGTFRGEPQGQVDFGDVFAPYESALSHQIGSCRAHKESLFVSVGDGGQPNASRKVDQLLGKVLRMTLDGRPHPDNPFSKNQDLGPGADYVWAYGLRNPFGLEVVDGQVFVVDNGPSVDRFLHLQEGQGYHWDGSDWSIGSAADALFSPGVGPVHLDYRPPGSPVLPDGHPADFLFAASGSAKDETAPGVVSLSYDLEEGRTDATPAYLVQHRGKADHQDVAALALGPDGLYFAPILPNRAGGTMVLKVWHDPESDYPYVIGEGGAGYQLMGRYGCFSCHSLEGRGGEVGPTLDPISLATRLRDRLHSEAYVESIQQLDQLDQEPYSSYQQERHEVLEAEGRERIKLWIKYRIMEPRFDNTTAQMPDLGVSEEDAIAITQFLMGGGAPRAEGTVAGRIEVVLGNKLFRAGLAAGVLVGLFLAALWLLGRWLWRRRATDAPQPATETGAEL